MLILGYLSSRGGRAIHHRILLKCAHIRFLPAIILNDHVISRLDRYEADFSHLLESLTEANLSTQEGSDPSPKSRSYRKESSEKYFT